MKPISSTEICRTLSVYYPPAPTQINNGNSSYSILTNLKK